MCKTKLKASKNPDCKELKNSSKGFTLIELSIVILITGLLTVPLIKLYTDYLREQKIITTKDNLITVARAVALFNPIRYPCPSDRSLPTTDANYGTDVCSLPTFTLAAIPLCDTSGNEQGICKTPGARDTEDDADSIAGNNNEFVLIGGVPLKTLVLNPSTHVLEPQAIGTTGANIYDGWDHQFTYAVSYTSASSGNGFTRFKNGVIEVQDEWGNNTAGTDKDAHFIVISHGQDGFGAFNNAQVKSACAMGDPDIKDAKNCDGDSTFVQGISHYGGSIKYDDYSYVQTDSSANLWQIITDPDSNAPTSHIKTIPTGKLGIKLTKPGEDQPTGIDVRLDVGGTIRADSVRAMEICKEDGTNCIPIGGSKNFFGSKKGPGEDEDVQNACGNGEVITSIGNNKVTCAQPEFHFNGPRKCPAGTWIEQIKTDGSIVCTGGIAVSGE